MTFRKHCLFGWRPRRISACCLRATAKMKTLQSRVLVPSARKLSMPCIGQDRLLGGCSILGGEFEVVPSVVEGTVGELVPLPV